MTSLLRFKGVTLRRGGRLLFEGLDLKLDDGQALQIAGPNGSGKSSLIRLAAGLLRQDGGRVLLPPGRLRMVYGRGPEYRRMSRDVIIPDRGGTDLDLRLERWVDPRAYGYYVGDHHIHAAGCAHYNDPTQGVRPEDMFLQVKGEALNVGCILTWGPCFDYQRRFFSGAADRLSEPLTVPVLSPTRVTSAGP